MLDAACGIGLDAVWLSRYGFDVTAGDGSAAMVAEARRRVRDAGLAVPIHRVEWSELPEHFAGREFDVVLCTGNSIAHAADADAMVAALRAFGAVVRPGGLVVLDTHDWEAMAERGDVTVVDPVVVDRWRTRCQRTYRWSWADHPWTCTLTIDMVLVRGDRQESRTHRVHLHPFTAAGLRHRLRRAGLVEIELDVGSGEDRYSAVARRPR